MKTLGIKLEFIFVNTPEQNGHIDRLPFFNPALARNLEGKVTCPLEVTLTISS